MEISPQELINDLDEGLKEAGTQIILRRLYGTQRIPSEVSCLAVVREKSLIRTNEIAGDIQEANYDFIISPTEINKNNWPGFHNNEPENSDLRIPRKNDEIETTRGKLTVQECEGIYVQGILVRIQGWVRGD